MEDWPMWVSADLAGTLPGQSCQQSLGGRDGESFNDRDPCPEESLR